MQTNSSMPHETPAKSAAIMLSTDGEGSLFTGVEHLGSVDIRNGTMVDGFLLGGLSGLTRLPDGTYAALSDAKDGLRTFKLGIDLGDGRLDPGDVTLNGVSQFTDAAGGPFPPSDPEAAASAHDGSFYISSEGSNQPPFIRHFDAAGREIGALHLPKALTDGYAYNRGIESLALSPDGARLFAGTEHPLTQDRDTTFADGLPSRIFEFDTRTGAVAHEFVYTIDDFGRDGHVDDNGLVEMISLGGSHLLALERVYISGQGNSIRLYEVDTKGASDVARLEKLSDAGGTVVPVQKTLLANLGFLPNFLAGTNAFVDTRAPDNIEGMTLGPRLDDGRQTIILVSDNNFRGDGRQITKVVTLALESGEDHAPTFHGLDGDARYLHGGPAVLLDADATIADPELDHANSGHGDYRGASLTIERHGGASTDDHFSATGALGSLTAGSALVYAGAKIGTVEKNSGGTLKLAFNGNAGADAVDHVMQSIAYANSNHHLPGVITLGYTFDDGTSGLATTGQVEVTTGFKPTEPGFTLVDVSDWYNPSWGGGFIANFEYVVQASDLEGGSASAWTIEPNYHGVGTLTNAWVNGNGGAVSATIGPDGRILLTTLDQSYKVPLKAGDTLRFSVQGEGASFNKDDVSFDFTDRDVTAAPGNASIDAHLTNDWSGDLSQTVAIHNSGTQTIDNWQVLLDVADGVDVLVTSVWGASVAKTEAGDLLFSAADWNGTMAKGGEKDFGFTVGYHGVDHLSFDDTSFTFVSPTDMGHDWMI